jgi:hypothetical protein
VSVAPLVAAAVRLEQNCNHCALQFEFEVPLQSPILFVVCPCCCMVFEQIIISSYQMFPLFLIFTTLLVISDMRMVVDVFSALAEKNNMIILL